MTWVWRMVFGVLVMALLVPALVVAGVVAGVSPRHWSGTQLVRIDLLFLDSTRPTAPRGESGSSVPRGTPRQYDENGIDLSLIRANMRLSPSERARRAERARQAALRVQQIGRDARRQSA